MEPIDFLAQLGRYLNLSPGVLALAVGLAVTSFNLLGRYIPDDKTGFLGFIRDVSKILGLYLSNRITSRMSANDIARNTPRMVDAAVNQAITDQVMPRVEEVVRDTNPFQRGSDGRFLGRKGKRDAE